MSNRIRWNDDLDNALRDLRHKGVAMKDCVRPMGFSYLTIQRRCRVLGVNHRPPYVLKRTRVIELRKEGKTYTQIASQLGVTKAVVAGAIYRAKARGEL